MSGPKDIRSDISGGTDSGGSTGSHSAVPSDPDAVVRASSAGRDLPVAIAVGVALAAVALAALFIVKAAFVVFVLVAAMLGLRELSQALATGPTRVPRVPVTVGGVAMIVSAYWGGPDELSVATVLTALGCLLWRLAGGAAGYVRDASAGLLATIYVPLLGSFVVLMLASGDGAARVATFVLVTTASDIGGLAAGVRLGRHALAPTISPKKSWEGFAGSVAACMLVGWITVTYALDGDWWVGLVLGVAAAGIGTLGDLAESMIKRDLGIKDMGSLLPGHGGVMDRLDSLLAVAPVAWLILDLLVSTS